MVGFKTVTGKEVIKVKYWAIGYDKKFPEKMYKAACVYSNSGWIFINRIDSIILTPYIYGSGPDYIKEGLFRFVENLKIGFANNKFKKVISAKNSFETLFEQGYAVYFSCGEKIYELNKTAPDIIAANESFFDRGWVWAGTTITEISSVNKKGEI